MNKINEAVTQFLANSVISNVVTGIVSSAIMSLVFSKYGIYILLATFIFWLLFVSIMSLHKRKKQLIAGLLFYSLLPVGFIVDVVYNHTVGSVLFWELGKELTLSQRMTRHIKTGSGWRKSVATFVCKYLVEPWDYNHCHLQDIQK